jgi:PAS domain S-box-containing protein
LTSDKNLSKSDLVSALKAARTELSVIKSVQETLATSQDLQSIYDAVGDKIVEIFGAQTVGIYAADLINNLMRFPHLSERGVKQTSLSPVPINSMYQHIIGSGKTFVMNQGFADFVSKFSDYQIPYGELPKSLVTVPVIKRKEIWIYLSLQDMDHENAFSESDVQFLETLAASMKVALENAHLFDQVQSRNLDITEALERETASNDILRVIAESPTDIQPVFDVIAQNAAQLSGSEEVVIAIADDNTLRVVAHYGYISMIPVGEGIQLNKDSVAGRAILEGESLQAIHNQPGVKSDYPAGDKVAKKYGYHVTCAVPLMREDNAIGAISIRRTKPELLNKKQISLIESFANKATIAVENVRLFNETQRLLKETKERNTELAVINSVQTGLASKLDMHAIYDLVGDQIRDVFDAQIVTIVSYDRTNEQNIIHYAIENGERHFFDPQPTTAMYKELMATGTPIIIQENLAEKLQGKAIPMEGPAGQTSSVPKSGVWIPLTVGGTVMGHVSLQNEHRENAFSDSDIRLLQTLSNSMSVALENARLFDETQQRNAELAVINAVQSALAAELDIEAIYEVVGEKIREIFDANTILVITFDHENGTMHRHYAYEKGRRYQIDPTPIAPAWAYFVERAETTLINNGLEFLRQVDPQFVPPAGEIPKSFIAVPLMTKGKLTGAISIQNVDRENAFDETDVRLLETVVNAMSVAIENARLFDETQRLLKETEERNAELAVINSVQEGLASKLELEGIYTLVGDKISEITGAGVVLIASWDWDSRIMRAEYFQDQGKLFDRLERPLSALHDAVFPEIEEGKTIVWNEGIEERYRKFGHEVAAGQIPKSTIAVPLRISGKISSSIMIQDTQKEYAFSEETIRLVETLARSAGIALENAQLFDETTQRNAELAIVNSVSEAMSKNLDVDTVVKIVGDKVQQIFNADMVAIGFINEEEGVTEVPYSYALGEYFEEESFPLGDGLAGIMFKTRQPLLLNTEEELLKLGSVKTAADQHKEEQIQSWLGVPIIIGKKLIGGVSVQSYQTYAFDESDLRLLSTLAANMGAVIENARLFEETRRLLKETEERNAELAVINSVQAALAAELDLHGIYDAIGDKIREIFDAQTLMIGTFDNEANMAVINYAYEKGERLYPEPIQFTGLIDHINKTGEKVVINKNMMERAKEYGMVTVAGEMAKSGVWMPFKIGYQVRGIITLQNVDRENAFPESDVRLLETIANSMSVALENARLFDELQRSYREISESLERQTATGDILHIIANSPGEIQPVLEAVANHAANLCQADDVQIYRLEEDHLHQTAHFGPLPALQDTEFLPLDRGLLTGRAVLERRTIHADAGELSEEEYPISVELHKRLKHRSVIVTPLVREDESIGAIVVRRNDVRPFTETQISLLKTFANQAAIAIENVRLFEETNRLLAESRQQAEELKTVNTVSQALSSELELDALINLVGTQIQKIFSADVAYVALLNKEASYIEFPFNYGERADKIKFGEGLTSQVIKSGEPLLINQDEDWQKTEKRIGVVKSKSYLGVPITLGSEVIGVISVQSTKWSNMYGEKEERLLSTIAGNVGIAIHNAKLFNEVERQKKYFEALISSAPVAIINMDMEGKVTEWSPAAVSLFGYSTEEAMGADIDDLVANHPDVREEAEMLTQDYLESVGKIQLKSQRSHKDGHLIDVAINAMPVYLEGEMTGYIAIYNDISELEKARRDAEEANQAKSTFLANMSHELRTPLNAIIGFTRIVKRKATNKLAEKQINNLDKVLVSAEHLLGLINTVLDISKIEAGRMDLHITNFDIKSLIDLVLVTSQPLVRQEKVKLISEVSVELPPVHSDLEKIKQILINLVSNAAKFTHEGEIKVSVKMINDHLEIAVADTGIGISPESIDRIFQEFQQADVSTTREYGGTGLGLSISRSLARLLGGDLQVSSELGVGSIFTLTFPIYYGEKTQDHKERAAAVPGDDTSHLILIIDDNEDAIYLMRESLEDAGYRVATAWNGEEGLQLARELNPFAITLDIMMPKKDGWQVLHDLKSDPTTQKIPVIMVSIVDKKALGYRLGASDYLVKPLKDDQILQSLEKIKKTNGNKPLKKLLVVDDDPNVADMVQQLLEDRDYKIESASDGLIALEKIRENQPDVILLDLMMPRLDGLGLIEELKNDPELAGIPVIVITAKLLDENEKKALRESVGKVIHKQGLSSKVLLAEIGKTLENPTTKETNK